MHTHGLGTGAKLFIGAGWYANSINLLRVALTVWLFTAGSSAAEFRLELLAGGLAAPVGVEHAGDGSSRLFVVQQGGQIRIFRGGQLAAAPFLDIAGKVVCCGERGLLGLAFHPDYVINGIFFVNYTRSPDGATVIARYQRSAVDPDRAEAGSEMVLLTIPQPFANHNGGQIRFGPDGFLYIGMGDGGSGNDPSNRGQDLGTLLGKMLRIDVDSGLPYGIPTDNPFVDDANPATLGEIWSYGLRNPWRFSFDRLTGDMFIGDVGQNAWEEIDFEPRGVSGRNYGWRVMEGAHCTGLSPATPCPTPDFTLPIIEYSHGLPAQSRSVTGGFRYRGKAIPELYGRYLYADIVTGQIWAAEQGAGGAWTSTPLLVAPFAITTFGEDEAGELYVSDYGGGSIHRLVRTTVPPQRVWVSSSGRDTDPCSSSAPCRTFQGAVSRVAAGGEVVALDSADFGAVTIAKSLSLVAAEGVLAVVAPTGGVGVDINGLGTVVSLIGLHIANDGTATTGVRWSAGAELKIEDCVIDGFAANGIDLSALGKAQISRVVASNNAAAGIVAASTLGGGTSVLVHRSRIENNADGIIAAQGSRITVRDSYAVGNTNRGMAAVSSAAGNTAQLIVERSMVANNLIGVASSQIAGAAQVSVSAISVSGNGTGLFIGGGAAQMTSTGDNTLAHNGANLAGAGTLVNLNKR